MFPKNIKIEKIIGRDEYLLTEPFEYITDDLHIIAPAGFWTDGCSWPKTQLDLGGMVGFEAGVIHDLLYRLDSIPNVTKEKADLIFYKALRELNVPLIIARGMYRAVCLGGHSSYHKKSVDYRGEA